MPSPFRLLERIRQVRPCAQCAPTGGTHAVDAAGEVASRCGCLRGRLLRIADARRARGQRLSAAAA